MPESQRLISLFEVVRPHLHDAIRRVGLNYAYLLPECDLPLTLITRVGCLESLPLEECIFEIQLDSSILRWTRNHKEASFCNLRDPMAPWAEFCRRVNGLRKSVRRYFLAFLPRTMNGQTHSGWANREPNMIWAKFWDSLTVDIPASCLPVEWCEVRAGVSNLTPTQERNEIFVPNILKPKAVWEETLATPLFQAGIFAESRRPAWVKFNGCPNLMPESAALHAREFRESLKRIGGIPKGDRVLEQMVRKVLAWESAPESLQSVDPRTLLQTAKELGFDSFRIEANLGAIHERSSNSLEANRHFQRSLAEAQGGYDLSTALSNLSARSLMSGDFTQAIKLAKEALQYDASNEMARWNLNAALHSIHIQSNDSGTHG